jgi:hypothetical protein
MSSEAELAAARRTISKLRRIATEAIRGMSDEELLALRDRLERGDEDDAGDKDLGRGVPGPD